MYHITLYENGRFCTHVGGAVSTLPEAIAQIRSTASTLAAEELAQYFGYKFDRNGTFCAIIITDRWGMPIVKSEEE